MRLTLDSIRSLQTQGNNALSRLRQGADELRNGQIPTLGGADISGTSRDKQKFSINSFMTNMVAKDMALTSHFIFTLSKPDTPAMAQFAAHATTLPGFTLNTMEVRRYGHGPTYSYPMANVNPEIGVSFYVDAEGRILRFFQTWANAIFNIDVVDSPDAGSHYVLQYKSEYACDATLELYNREKNTYATYFFRNIYPSTIGRSDLAWADSSLLRLPIQFRFDTYAYGVGDQPSPQTQVRLGTLQDVRELLSGAADVLSQARQIREAVNVTRNQIESFRGFSVGDFF